MNFIKDKENPNTWLCLLRSKLIRVENFEAYFKKQHADSNCGFAEEYEDLKLVGISLPKYAAELAENRGKNRYNNVLPCKLFFSHPLPFLSLVSAVLTVEGRESRS